MYLGVDGGGTKTAFMIIDEVGKIHGYTKKRSCYYVHNSFETFKQVLEEGIKEVCSKAGINISGIRYSFFGMAGYGEREKDIPILEGIIEEILKSKDFTCRNDVEAGWAGSLLLKPGINIVAGTGTIGFGVDKNGSKTRSSGWGDYCDDGGSGFWLAKKAIELFVKEADGRLKKTPIYRIMKEELNLKNDFDILTVLYDEFQLKREKVANLSKLLYKAALEKDEYAIEMYEKAAYEHSLTIQAVINKLDFDQNEEILVSYTGGVFNVGSLILQPLKEYVSKINNNVKIVEPALGPVTGAALYALVMDKGDYNQDIVNRLKEQEKKFNR